MAAYQRSGVIIVSVILAILQKVKLQNYRLFILYDEAKIQSGFNSTSRQLLNNTDSIFEDVKVTNFLFQCLLVNNCLAVMSCVFLSSWSDRHGRKLLLILPYVGSFVSDIFMLVVLFVPTATSKMLLISEGIDGFFGGTVLMSLGCLCYITDSSDHRQRTFIIALFFGLYNAVPVMDMAFQYFWTPLETRIEFRVLVLCAVIYRMIFGICFLIYIKLCVSESVFVLGTFQGNPWVNLLTPINVSDTVSCVFKRRLDNMRLYIIVLTAIFILFSIALFGNIIVFPQYFKTVFLWPYKDLLIFSGIFTGCQTLTLWLTTYAATEWRVLDSDLGTYGCVSLGISCMFLTFSKHDYIAAVGVLISIGSLLVPVSVISVLSKLVERIETGSMYAGIGFLTLTTQLIAATSYNGLTEVGKEAGMPQVIFLLSFGLVSFCLLFFIYLKRSISPHLLGHLNGAESLALINRKGQIEHLYE